MKIPVFVSAPTMLNKSQDTARNLIIHELQRLGMEPRALGRTDYPTDLPLREVGVIAKHCSGGVILGFEQTVLTAGILKPKTNEAKEITGGVSFPSAWNNLEAGILFALGIPLLVFKEEHISGGVFDAGVTDVFIHKMPIGKVSPENKSALREVFLNWQRRVRAHYYMD